MCFDQNKKSSREIAEKSAELQVIHTYDKLLTALRAAQRDGIQLGIELHGLLFFD